MTPLLNLNTPTFNLEHFIELSPDLICIAGYDGYFKKINPAVSETLGYTNEELFSKPIDYFIHPGDRDATKSRRESIKKDMPLLNYENRYLTKSGEIIWLIWTSIPISTEKVVFAIAKNITSKKKIEELRRIAFILNSSDEQKKPYKERGGYQNSEGEYEFSLLNSDSDTGPSFADQVWLSELEALVRKYAGKLDININRLSYDLSMSERQLYRRVKSITGVTPNKIIRIIRLQIAKEAIETGKYRTISELANISGFETTTYFSKLFKEIYGRDINELL